MPSPLFNTLARGNAPAMIAPYLCDAALTALAKQSGGIRPIAVGDILRRLVAKYLAQTVHSWARDIFAPLQVGVAVPAGAEVLIHSIRGLVTAHGSDPSVSLLQIDFKNAFNQVDRATFIQEVVTHLRRPWALGPLVP
jgi:hypothetical protein